MADGISAIPSIELLFMSESATITPPPFDVLDQTIAFHRKEARERSKDAFDRLTRNGRRVHWDAFLTRLTELQAEQIAIIRGSCADFEIPEADIRRAESAIATEYNLGCYDLMADAYGTPK